MIPDETYSSKKALSFKGKSYVCPLEIVMDVIGGKWKLLLVNNLREGPVRSAVLQHSLGGISNKMFTQSVRELEKDGLIKREIFPVVPPKVEYSLTELGKTIIPAVEELSQWGNFLCEHEKASTEVYPISEGLNDEEQKPLSAEHSSDDKEKALEAETKDSSASSVPDPQNAAAGVSQASLDPQISDEEDEEKRKAKEFKSLVDENYDLI